MKRDDLLTWIKGVMEEYFDIPPACVHEGAELADLGLDSLDEVELLMVAEETYNIEITNEDGEQVRTVGDALDLVLRLLPVSR